MTNSSDMKNLPLMPGLVTCLATLLLGNLSCTKKQEAPKNSPTRLMVTSRAELIHLDHKLVTIEGKGTSYKDEGFGLLLKDAFVRLEGSLQPEFIGANIRAIGVLRLTNSIVTEQQVENIKRFASEQPTAQLAIPAAGTNIVFVMDHPKVSLVE